MVRQMENMGEISVIIPFYNAERHIKTCIKSLKDQTYPYYKAYFVDDGSTDNSAEILKKYMDSRFVLFQQEKRGVSAARNLGMKQSSGDYLAFMDVDDELAPDYLEKFIKAAREHNVDIVLCNYVERFANGRTNAVLLPWENIVIARSDIQEELFPNMIAGERGAKSIMGSVWRTFVKRSFWERTGLRFNEEIYQAEDLLFVLALYNRTDRIYVLRDCSYIYRRRARSSTNKSYDPDNLEQHKKLHSALGAVLEQEEILQKNLARYQANGLCAATYAISNLARNPDLTDSYRSMKYLREYIFSGIGDYKSSRYLNSSRKLSLWMLEHKMYLMLLILYKIKERFRMRDFFS